MNRLIIAAIVIISTFKFSLAQVSDSLEIYAQIEKGLSVSSHFSKETESIFNELIVKVDNLDIPQWEYDVLQKFGTRFKKGKPIWSLDKLSQAYALSNANIDIPISKKLLFDIGQLYHYSEKAYDLALTKYNRCEELISQSGEPHLSRLLFEIIDAGIKRGNNQIVVEYLAKSWDNSTKLNERDLVLKTAGLQLQFDIQEKNYTSIIDHSEGILPYITSNKEKRIQYNLQGSAYRDIGQLNKANSAFQKALSYSTDASQLYDVYLDMAVCYQAQGVVNESIDSYIKAIENAPNETKKARAYLFLARSYYSFRGVKNQDEYFMIHAREENKNGYSSARKVQGFDQLILDTMYYDTEYLIEKFDDNNEEATLARERKATIVHEINQYRKKQHKAQRKNETNEAIKKQILEQEAEKKAKERALFEAEKQSVLRRIEVAEESANRDKAEKRAAIAQVKEAEQRTKRKEAELQIKISEIETEKAQYAQNVAEKNATLDRSKALEAENRAKIADFEIAQAKADEQRERDLATIEKETVKRQRYLLIGLFVVLLLTGYFYNRNHKQTKIIRRNKLIIEEEKERSENLLLSILPKSITEELKANQTVVPQHYDQVSVLFSDFKGFTRISEGLKPTELLERLNIFFALFDEVSIKNNLERIKTIGDAYMAAGGLPEMNKTNALDAVRAAVAIQKGLKDVKFKLGIPEEEWSMRVGVHTGPVVAGVVGTTKFAYDIWGDAVNIASRLESKSEEGRVNISRDTYDLIKDHFECQYRGEIEIKNRGKIEMYFVVSEK